MPANASAEQSLRRVFNDGFSVRDIAEPLTSFDVSIPSTELAEFMDDRAYQVIGLRRDGLTVGFAERADLDDGQETPSVRDFHEAVVVDESTSLATAVLELRETPRIFVELLGRVGGIVTRSDLQKPPVRMWLFGMITLIEMRFARLIERFCPDDGWRDFISAGRLKKARDLLAERQRRDQALDLVDCLQFSDKGQIIARNEMLRNLTRFESRKQLEKTVKGLERLRNNLAHAQDIISGDWEMIVLLSENLDAVLDGPPGLSDAQPG